MSLRRTGIRGLTAASLAAASLAAASLAALAIGPVLAAGSSAPFSYTPDPALQRDTPAQLQGRVSRTCINTQARVQNVAATQVQRGCGCYASRVMKSLDGGELAAYRATGVFNDTARAKAFAALDGCGLRRPA